MTSQRHASKQEIERQICGRTVTVLGYQVFLSSGQAKAELQANPGKLKIHDGFILLKRWLGAVSLPLAEHLDRLCMKIVLLSNERRK